MKWERDRQGNYMAEDPPWYFCIYPDQLQKRKYELVICWAVPDYAGDAHYIPPYQAATITTLKRRAEQIARALRVRKGDKTCLLQKLFRH